jgi:hypothetical protein
MLIGGWFLTNHPPTALSQMRERRQGSEWDGSRLGECLTEPVEHVGFWSETAG